MQEEDLEGEFRQELPSGGTDRPPDGTMKEANGITCKWHVTHEHDNRPRQGFEVRRQ